MGGAWVAHVRTVVKAREMDLRFVRFIFAFHLHEDKATVNNC